MCEGASKQTPNPVIYLAGTVPPVLKFLDPPRDVNIDEWLVSGDSLSVATCNTLYVIMTALLYRNRNTQPHYM